MKKIEDFSTKTQFMFYMKAIYDLKDDDDYKEAVFCTSDPKYHKLADELISEGIILEPGGFKDPGGNHRSFEFTERGLNCLPSFGIY